MTAAIMSAIRERACVLCIEKNRILSVRHQDPAAGGFWGVPGGGIEPGETPLEAAIRETREETGYRVELIHDPNLAVEYDFVWGETIVRCRTHWFGVRPVPGVKQVPHVGDERFITGLRWIEVNDREKLFAGHRELQWAIASVIDNLITAGLVV